MYFDTEIALLKDYFKNEIESLKKTIKTEMENLKGTINDLSNKHKTNLSYSDTSSAVNGSQESLNSTCFLQNNNSATKTPQYSYILVNESLVLENQPTQATSNTQIQTSIPDGKTNLTGGKTSLPSGKMGSPGGAASSPCEKKCLPGGKTDFDCSVSDAYWNCDGCPAKFGFLLLKSLFPHEVLLTSNVSGKRGLRKLDESVVALVKSSMMNLFNVNQEELKLIFEKMNIRLKNFRRIAKK